MKETDADKKVLDPGERAAETLFGLIMVLSFTVSISAATGGREEVRTILFGAIGCNLAWGVVDAVMWVLAALTERSRKISILNAVRGARDAKQAHALIADALPPFLARLSSESDLEHLRAQILLQPDPPPRAHLTWKDLRGAVGVFLLVFLTTFPVVIPFMVIQETRLALRVSNAVAIVMLFVAGHRVGAFAGLRPVLCGLTMVGVGLALVLITVALGG